MTTAHITLAVALSLIFFSFGTAKIAAVAFMRQAGNHGGRPKVIDDDMLTFALALKDKGVPLPDIAKKLTIKTGKNAGKNPPVASLYRALAEAEEVAIDDGLPLRPKPVHIRRPEDPLTREEIDLRERLQAQPPGCRRALLLRATGCVGVVASVGQGVCSARPVSPSALQRTPRSTTWSSSGSGVVAMRI
ncbi:hypothetical protein [Streptomyces sp. NBC_00425]|uniref:hypothetical protein n=1 Tax=Streptomyces sp. NBC_00425 TaxID=2975740 RepID=UPI002E23A8E7